MNNFTKAARFERPDYIPMIFSINSSCWHHYPKEALWDLMEEHKFLFPNFTRPTSDWQPSYPLIARADEPYRDVMGCVWHTSDNGITGTVHDHPLADWDNFKTWKIADPDTSDGLYQVDWEERFVKWKKLKEDGKSFRGSLRHGHTFLQLCDLRGYENLLCDMFDEEPLLDELIDQLTTFNLAIVNKFISSGCCYAMSYPEDLGMQLGPMISPDMFRKYIKPAYQKLMKPAKDAGLVIHMHSDGDIRTLVDDLVVSGVDMINLQDLVNGIDWIAEKFKGKVCVELDIDRQRITPFGTPEQIDALILEEVSKIATRDGGLCMIYGLYPGVPLENAKAIMDSMEKYAFYFS